VRGNWVLGLAVAGADAGTDQIYGTPDDLLVSTSPAGDTIASIASIRIRGQVLGGATTFIRGTGFVAEEIGRLQVGTARITLQKGAGNDNLMADDPRLTFGFFRDVTAREVTS
jgi:hypothetical protein